jgi:hypothetical protein
MSHRKLCALALVMLAWAILLFSVLSCRARVVRADPAPRPEPKSSMWLDSTVVAGNVRVQRFNDPDHGVVCYVATIHWDSDLVGTTPEPTISCVKP